MKGLLYKEWQLGKKNILCFFSLALVFSILGFLVFLSMKCGNLRSWANEPVTVNVYAQVFFYVPYAFVLLAAEECSRSVCRDYEAGWMKFAYTLPMSAGKTVGVKFLMSVLVMAGAVFYGLLNGLMISAMSGVELSVNTIGNMFMLLLVMAVFDIVFFIPFAMKVKTVKALNAGGGVVVFILYIVSEVLLFYLMETYGEEVIKTIIDTYKEMIGWLLPVSLLLVLVSGVISFFISVKIYQRRAR